MTSLRAGAAIVDITPPFGGRLDGYGGRTHGSQGVHDPLMARALVLECAGERCAIVSCDLLGIHPDVTARIRERVRGSAGIAPEAAIIAATHNHAGPAGLRGGMFSRLDEPLAAKLADKISAVIEWAAGSLRTATLKLGQADIDTVSMNRRDPDWPIDPVMRLLLVDGEDSPIASILNFACHATVLKGANLMISGEFPGAAARLLLEQTGAPCVYLNGACGDVNPTWIRQDFESVERAGQIIGGQALRVIGELRTLGPGQRAHNIRWDEFPEKPVPGRVVQPHLKTARKVIDLPLRRFDSDEEYSSRIEVLESLAQRLAVGSGERRDVMAQLTRLQSERWAATWARRQPAKTLQRTEVQALSLGEDLALLALPGEFFVETAEAIRSTVARRPGRERTSGITDLFVACYANDYIGYLIPPPAYEQGGYEAGITFCPPEAEGIIQRVAIEALREAAA